MVRVAGTEIHEPVLWDVYSKAAFVFTESGFIPQAEELIHRAQTLAHEVGDIFSEIKLSAQLASIFGKLARYQEAAECLSRALLIVQKIASSSVMALRLRTMRAENLARAGSTDQALEEFISIFTTIDAVQQILDKRKYRIRFLATTRAVAEVNQAELLIKNQNIPGAFRAFEQNKLNSINELLWLGDAKTSSLFRKLGLFRISVRDASTSVDRMSAAIQGLKLKLAKPIEESTLWEILASLPQRVLIAHYACTSDGVHLFIPDTLKRQICHHKIAMTAASLALCMNNLRDEVIKSIKYGEPLEQTWQEFAIRLIEPLLPYLPNCELLCIIPHGLLNSLPFHAIPVAGRYLLEYCPIVYAPAVTTALMNRSETAWKWQSALVVGNPSGDLRHATLEAVEVAKILGTRPLLLNESKMKLWTQPRHEDIIHISSHGFFDPANPYLSGIVMADGILTIEQILELDLDAQLVTLNACETGLSQSNTGRELIGLSNALSSNGARSVIVSLWPVDQEASAILMKRMYAYLIQDSFTPAHALQLAQLELAYQKSWCHPYYWAPFVVTGNW